MFAAAAGRLAVQDADLDPASLTRMRAGTVMGAAGGEAPVIQQLTGQWLAAGLKSMTRTSSSRCRPAGSRPRSTASWA